MGAKFHSWWQTIRKPLMAVGIIVACTLGIALIVGIIGGYLFNWNWTGLRQKTLWDWMQLLIIPVVLALGGYLFTFTISRNERKASDRHNQTEREIAQDNQREVALQTYIKDMSELLLHENLCGEHSKKETQDIAQVQTITILRRLDADRKGIVLQFLRDAGLIIREFDENSSIGNDDSIISLSKVDLRGANLHRAFLLTANFFGADLCGANLSRAILDGANLFGANLSEADLSETSLFRANLPHANLSGANLQGADLGCADLETAIVTPEQLNTAKSLKGATMPDGSVHP